MPHYRLFYHFVWTTKHRLPLITADNQAAIHKIIRDKAAELNGLVHALNSVSDHVHLVVTVPPSMALSAFVKQIKGTSSHLASRLTPDSEPFVWQEDYGVYSVSESHVDHVVRYVDNQQRHHNEQTLDPRLEP